MNILFTVVISIILIVYLLMKIIKIKKRAEYLKAGKQWESIVRELRERK